MKVRRRPDCYGSRALHLADSSPPTSELLLPPDLAWIDEHRWVGATEDGSKIVAARYTRHPNRGILDAALTLSVDGVQTSVHVSGRMAPRSETSATTPIPMASAFHLTEVNSSAIGPLSIECIRTHPGDDTSRSETTGVYVHLESVAGVLEHEMPAFRVDGGATWSSPHDLRCPAPGSRLNAVHRHAWSTGDVHGQPLTVMASHLVGTRRSRVLDPPLGRAPEHHFPPSFWWSTHLRNPSSGFPEPFAESAIESGMPVGGGTMDAPSRLHLSWLPGTRWPATIRHETAGELRPLGRLLLTGLGHHSTVWEPGRWHDELAIGVERWHQEAVASQGVRYLHAITVVGPESFGFVETLPVGAIPARGLAGFIDG